MRAASPSKIEKILAFIAQHGSARSPEIAEHVKTPQSTIQALLAGPLEKGYLISCLVERPGKPAINEYRLSASVSESKQSWADFKIAARLSTTPLKIAKDRPPREPPASKRPASGIIVKKPETSAPPPKPIATPPAAITGSPIKAAPIATPSRRDPQRIIFMVDSNGQLRIEIGDKTITCTCEETCDAGELLVAAQPIWSQ